MPVLADDDVVVHGNAERCCDVDDGADNPYIGLRRHRVAGGVKRLPQSGMSGSSPQIADPTLLAAADPTLFAAENGEPILAPSIER